MKGQTIELELFGDSLILFKKDVEWLYDTPFDQTSNSNTGGGSIVYGEYSCAGNNVGGTNIAYVDLASDTGEDFILIDYYDDPDDKPANTFGGTFIGMEGNSYIVESNPCGDATLTLRITFTEGGMNIEFVSSSGYEYDPEVFCGHYNLDEALNLNEVG